MTPERLVLVTAIGKDTDISNYSAIAELAAALAACQSELHKWQSAGRPDDLEALRIQAQQPVLEAQQAYIDGLVAELAAATKKRLALEVALRELLEAYVEENDGDMPWNDSHPAHAAKVIL